jgi:hypothetical protein
MFSQKIINFHSYENIYWKFICVIETLDKEKKQIQRAIWKYASHVLQ